MSKRMGGVKSEQLYGHIIRLGHTCGFISFHWGGSAVALEYDGSKVRKIWQALLFIGLTLYQSFLGFQCWTALENKQADTKQQIGLLYATIITIFLSINHYVHIFHGQDYVRLMNASRTFVSSRNALGHESRTVVRYMKLVSFIAIFGSVTVSLLTILKPESPRVFTSIAVHPQKLPLPLKAVAAVIHLLINSYHYYALCLQTSSIFLIAHDITLVIRQLLVLNIGSPYNFHALVKNYRALAVLQANYASIYRHWMSIMELANVVVVILNVYQAVIVRSYRALVLAFTVGTGFCCRFSPSNV